MHKKFDLRSFIKSIGTGAVLAALVFLLGYHRGYALMRCFCDAFFISAVILLGVSGILLARNAGTFDTMGYSIKFTFLNHFPGAKYKDEDIMDYVTRKEKTRKSSLNVFLAGVVYMVFAVIFLIIYYM